MNIEEQNVKQIREHLEGGGHYAHDTGLIAFATQSPGGAWLYVIDDPTSPFGPAREVGALLMQMGRGGRELSEWRAVEGS